MEFLGNDRDAAMAAVAGGGKPGRIDTFGQLATAYLASPDFQRLAPATQKLNRLYVDELRERFRPPRGNASAPAIVWCGCRRGAR